MGGSGGAARLGSFAINSGVLPLGPDGSQLSDQPFSIPDSGGKTGWLYGVYLQDEWKPFANLTIVVRQVEAAAS